MKTLRILAVAAAVGVFAFAAQAADSAPPLALEQAVKIAQDYLKTSGAGSGRYIESVVLEKVTIGGERYWSVAWSAPIRGGERPEMGLRIDMKGELTKLVGASPVPGVGLQRVGARNIR